MKNFIKKVICLTIILLLFITPIVLSIEIQIKNDDFLNNSFKNTSESFSFPNIKIKDVKGGFKLLITIENEGNIDYHNIRITTRLKGGLILPTKVRNHEIVLLSAEGLNSTNQIKDKIFGLGKVEISIGLNITGDEELIIGQVKALVIGSFIIIIKRTLIEQNPYDGYTLFTLEYSKDTYLINNAGEVVYQWKGNHIQGLATYLLENGNLIRSDRSKEVITRFLWGGFTGYVGIYDPNGSLVWDFEYSSDLYCLHHDIEVLPNGNILMTAAEYIKKGEAIENGRDPGSPTHYNLCPDKIIEVKPTGNSGGEIVWEWRIWDHLIQDYDQTKKNYEDVEKHPELIDVNFGAFDYTHVNSIDYNEKFDQILLCSRELNEIWIIDHSTTTEEAAGHTGGRYGKGGDLLYRWGNPRVYRAGDEEDQQLFHPHGANWIESGCPGEGHILLFNNKRELTDEPKPGSITYYSSVYEIVPPVDFNGNYHKITAAYGPISPTWSYYDEENPHDFYSSTLSGAQRLPNGNTLICEGNSGNFFEVTPEKDIVWEYQNPYGPPYDVFNIYRHSPDYPGIKILLD